MPLPLARCDTRLFFFKLSKAGLWVFFLLEWLPIKAEEPSLPYSLPLAERRTEGFIPFSTSLVWSEKQTASSKILFNNKNNWKNVFKSIGQFLCYITKLETV